LTTPPLDRALNHAQATNPKSAFRNPMPPWLDHLLVLAAVAAALGSFWPAVRRRGSASRAAPAPACTCSGSASVFCGSSGKPRRAVAARIAGPVTGSVRPRRGA